MQQKKRKKEKPCPRITTIILRLKKTQCEIHRIAGLIYGWFLSLHPYRIFCKTYSSDSLDAFTYNNRIYSKIYLKKNKNSFFIFYLKNYFEREREPLAAVTCVSRKTIADAISHRLFIANRAASIKALRFAIYKPRVSAVGVVTNHEFVSLLAQLMIKVKLLLFLFFL